MENLNKQLIHKKHFLNNPLSPILLMKYDQWKDHSVRLISHPHYNFFFDYINGYSYRCGKSIQDDPLFSPIGPEILDMEISTICSQGCEFCYKSNTSKGKNMSYHTFRKIFDKMPPNLTQIAFGIGDLDGNPHLKNILNYCDGNVNSQKHYVVPNITINGYNLTDDYIQLFVDCCGAVAVSHYEDDVCFDAVHRLIRGGMKQVNIHQMLSEETYEDSIRLMKSYLKDDRLKGLKAIVFLSLKTKGRGITYTPLSQSGMNQLVKFAFKHNVPIGFDSCSTLKFFRSIQDHPNKINFKTTAEPCESSLFSSYINVNGEFYPCSFIEGSMNNWLNGEGIDVIHCNDFLEDVWYHDKTKQFREQLLQTSQNNECDCRECPVFKI